MQTEKIALCPYCKEKLPKFPNRKTKCPFCNKTYYVRTDPFSREQVVITEAQIQQNEHSQNRYYALAEFKGMLINIMPDLFEKLYKSIKEAQQKQSQEGQTEGDVLWGVSNRMLIEGIKNNAIDIGQIYWAQSAFLHSESKDYTYIGQKRFELELHKIQKNGLVKSVEIITGKNVSCPECQKLDGKILTIAEALQQKLLPCRQCMRKINPEAPTGWCRCLYGGIID